MSRPVPGQRLDYNAFTQITTRWNDNDVYGHMNNVVHYQLFDTAVNGHLIDQGALDFRAGETVFLVVETGCKYYGEISFPDIVTAGIRVVSLGTSSVRYEIGLFRNDATDASAEGFFVHVNVNKKSRRPTPIEQNVRSVLERLKAKA
ncbi:MAG: thioesterase family protein [Planktotalea sp.]|uniref:acyl-CoA thioesterase n=1 Tax=Planktotalea sp. TaxID=2029877 RepID=UPI003C791C2E